MINRYTLEISENISDLEGYTNNKSMFTSLSSNIEKFLAYHDEIEADCRSGEHSI